MAEMTVRQREVLEFLRTYQTAHGYGPSLREIAMALGMASTNAVADKLRALEGAKLITRGPRGVARSIRVVG